MARTIIYCAKGWDWIPWATGSHSSSQAHAVFGFALDTVKC